MLLRVSDLTKTFPGTPAPVIDGLSVQLDRGQTLALTGESGSGKSTFLHLVSGLETAERGRIEIDGTDITPLDDRARAALRRGTIGLVFQQFNLIPSLDAAQNIAFQARLAGTHDPHWADHLTERLGLAEHAAKYPEQLSGGQQQRVAIGRTLAARPALVLADEPTGNLDEDTGDAVLELMRELIDETGAALLMVTHSTRLAAALDARVHLSHGRIAPWDG